MPSDEPILMPSTPEQCYEFMEMLKATLDNPYNTEDGRTLYLGDGGYKLSPFEAALVDWRSVQYTRAAWASISRHCPGGYIV